MERVTELSRHFVHSLSPASDLYVFFGQSVQVSPFLNSPGLHPVAPVKSKTQKFLFVFAESWLRS